PDAGTASATRALRRIPALMRAARTSADSVEVRLHEAEAHRVLHHTRDACRVLLDVEPRAAVTRFRALVRSYLDDPALGCRTR
ncbi:MAG TPA: hypothetical protein VFV33_20400, partial [Gemmatimonadaceae bacterium]|nr:hypothetical protein [Gemmatimonadaceae bacterium]